jgi:hypothetical protein
VKATGADFTTYVNDSSSTKLIDKTERPVRETDDWEISAKLLSVDDLRKELKQSDLYKNDRDMCTKTTKMHKGEHQNELNCCLYYFVPYYKLKYPDGPPAPICHIQPEKEKKEKWAKFVQNSSIKTTIEKLNTMFIDNSQHNVNKREEIKLLTTKKLITKFIQENNLENKFN